ncbi:hypothetical protein [Streptomyces fumanus]|uniref:hypothetical protein n=1 Tax=Streptomyces fumanus TaxID=67302 RepID=UPI003410E13D
MSDAKVYVVLESGRIESVDPAPLPADRFGNGHFWMFDGFASDMDDPYSCGLCGEAKWKSYRTPCANGRTPEELNAERAQWIADNRFVGALPWYVREGVPVAA